MTPRTAPATAGGRGSSRMASTGATRLARTDRRNDGRTARDDEPEDDAEHDPPTADDHRSFRRLEAHAARRCAAWTNRCRHRPGRRATASTNPRTTASPSTRRRTCRTDAPRARRRPSSRTRCAISIENVLTTTNPPTTTPRPAKSVTSCGRNPMRGARVASSARITSALPPSARSRAAIVGSTVPLRVEGDEQRVEAGCTGEQPGRIARVEEGEASEAERLAVRGLAHARHDEVLDRSVSDDPDGAPDVDAGPFGGAPVEHDLARRRRRALPKRHRRDTRVVDPGHADRRAEPAQRWRAVRRDHDGLAGHDPGRGGDAVERSDLVEDLGRGCVLGCGHRRTLPAPGPRRRQRRSVDTVRSSARSVSVSTRLPTASATPSTTARPVAR